MAYLHVIDPGPNRVLVIKTIREISGCSLKEAKECMEGTFCADLGEAPLVQQQLSAAGCANFEILMNRKMGSRVPRSWYERLLDDSD